MTEKNERQLLEEISTKLDKITGFVAITGREENEQIRILRSMNFEWGDIGLMVGLKADAARKRFDSIKNDSLKAAKVKSRLKEGRS